MTEIVL